MSIFVMVYVKITTFSTDATRVCIQEMKNNWFAVIYHLITFFKVLYKDHRGEEN